MNEASSPMMPRGVAQRWCLTTDDDGHWYVIPVERQDAFDEYVRQVGDGEYPDQPAWAIGLGHHPTWISFENWRSDL